jgi:hypothetical protein
VDQCVAPFGKEVRHGSHVVGADGTLKGEGGVHREGIASELFKLRDGTLHGELQPRIGFGNLPFHRVGATLLKALSDRTHYLFR